jgi:maltooligosyltrehalose trehalohydrolase
LHAAPHSGLLDWHKKLIALRRQESALTDGRLENVGVEFDEQARWFIVERGEITVACNLAQRRQTVPIGPQRPTSLRLASEPKVEVYEGGIVLPPDSVAVLGD